GGGAGGRESAHRSGAQRAGPHPPRRAGGIPALPRRQADRRPERGGHRVMMNFNGNDTAVVFIDPQNEVLSETGAAWSAVGASVRSSRPSPEGTRHTPGGRPVRSA